MKLRFQILGLVQARQRGVVLPLRGAKHRTLLAVLLLHANRVVPVEQIIDKVWPDRPPQSARNLVHGYVSDIRHMIDRSDREGLLQTTGPGYQLNVERGQLDLQRFEQLVQESRAARDAGETQHAADRLRSALELWNGAPLTGVSRGALEGETARLEEVRFNALDERIDLDLELGRHAQVIADLTALRAAWPFRQRPLSLLMVALYRAGRQAEALEVYRDARRQFISELGLEPGPDLQRLESALLKADPSLSR